MYRLLVFILIIKACIMALLVTYGPLSLGPDEAQYWTWSQALDFGYFSKPPGIAYQIAATTSLIGNTVLGVRASAIFMGLFTGLALFRLGTSCGLTQRQSTFGALTWVFSPMGILGSFLTTTDGGLFLFWTLTLCELAASVKEKRAPYYSLVGALILLGGLFKWPIFLLWPIVLIGCLRFPLWRRPLALLGGFLISLLAFVPTGLWNWEHEGATFRHVGATIAAAGNKGNPLDFLGAQVGLLSPLFFLFWFVALKSLWKKDRKGVLFFFSAISTLIIAGYFALSFFKKLQGNWCVFAYAPIMVLIGWYVSKRVLARFWWGVTLLVCFFGIIGALLLPSFPLLPYGLNPWKQLLGWNKIPAALTRAGWKEGEFLFADNYQTASLLSFYNPTQQRAYLLNLHGHRKNQFSYWPQMKDEQLGKDGIFIWTADLHKESNKAQRIEREQEDLLHYFEEVDFLGEQTLYPGKSVFIYRCIHYNGKVPEVIERFN